MMKPKHLVLIRHTKSSWSHPGLTDFERPLKKDRLHDAERMSRKLASLGLSPDHILCSPARRTRQTVEYFSTALGYPHHKIEFEQRLYESSAGEYLQCIRMTDAAVHTLVVVGHNPSLTQLANYLLPGVTEWLPTTGVVWFSLDTNDWNIDSATPIELYCYLTPKTI